MEGYITSKEAALRWNVSVRSVQALCAEGKIEGGYKDVEYLGNSRECRASK